MNKKKYVVKKKHRKNRARLKLRRKQQIASVAKKKDTKPKTETKPKKTVKPKTETKPKKTVKSKSRATPKKTAKPKKQ